MEKPDEPRRAKGAVTRLSIELLPEHAAILSQFFWGMQKPFFQKLISDIGQQMQALPALPILYLSGDLEVTFTKKKAEAVNESSAIA